MVVEGGVPPNLANRVGPMVLAILCEIFMTHTAHTHDRSRVELSQNRKGERPMTEQQKSERTEDCGPEGYRQYAKEYPQRASGNTSSSNWVAEANAGAGNRLNGR